MRGERYSNLFYGGTGCDSSLVVGSDNTLAAVWSDNAIFFAEQTLTPTKHYYAPSTPSAGRSNRQRLATRVDDDLYYIHSDHLGSTTLVTDDSGNEVGRVQYDPYGNIITNTIPLTLTDRLRSMTGY